LPLGRWLSSEDMLKKKRLFVENGQPHGTVVLNWHGTAEREFTYFAEAFRVIAQESAAALRQNGEFGLDGTPIEDFRAYPVVFLYRHALELYMKAVLLVGAPMLGLKGQRKLDREQLFRTHNLDLLRQDLERIFEVYGWSWDLDSPHFRTVQDFRAVIKELHAVDSGSYAFRYPVDTKGAASLESNFCFNLFRFCEILDELFPTLEGAAIGAHEELQTTLQQMAEAHEYEMENSPHDYNEGQDDAHNDDVDPHD
jgi:hypothetical protein